MVAARDGFGTKPATNEARLKVFFLGGGGGTKNSNPAIGSLSNPKVAGSNP